MRNRDNQYFLLLNAGHFLDHYFMLIFATAVALVLTDYWHLRYDELLAYAVPAFAAFAICSLPAGWLADRWSKDGMLVIFFIGSGLAAILSGFAQTPMQLGFGLFFIGVFGAIYHPVGLAIITMRWKNTGMRIAVNGVWGNLGVGCAALLTGIFIDLISWRAAFILPGIISVILGILYGVVCKRVTASIVTEESKNDSPQQRLQLKGSVWSLSLTVLVVSLLGSTIFQTTTFALPKIFEEQLNGVAEQIILSVKSIEILGLGVFKTSSVIGVLVFSVFAVASTAQLVVGYLLDKMGPRFVCASVALVQVFFFAIMPYQVDIMVYVVALCFMIGVFGQIPINDYLIGKLAMGKHRASTYGMRYVITFVVLAGVLPAISAIHKVWGFNGLYPILAVLAAAVFMLSYHFPIQRQAINHQDKADKVSQNKV